MIVRLAEADARAELHAKARGAVVLLDALRDDPLEAVVLSSSLNVHFGGEGQAAYVGANGALAGLGEALHAEGREVVVIDWDRWEGVGLAAAFERAFSESNRRHLPAGMTRGEGIAAFHGALASGLPQVAVSAAPFATRYAAHLSAHTTPPRRDDAGRSHGGPSDEPPARLEARLVDLCRAAFSEEDLDIDDRLVDLGTDSIAVLLLQTDIEAALGVRVYTAALMGERLSTLARACADPGAYPDSVAVVDELRHASAVTGGDQA